MKCQTWEETRRFFFGGWWWRWWRRRSGCGRGWRLTHDECMLLS